MVGVVMLAGIGCLERRIEKRGSEKNGEEEEEEEDGTK